MLKPTEFRCRACVTACFLPSGLMTLRICFYDSTQVLSLAGAVDPSGAKMDRRLRAWGVAALEGSFLYTQYLVKVMRYTDTWHIGPGIPGIWSIVWVHESERFICRWNSHFKPYPTMGCS